MKKSMTWAGIIAFVVMTTALTAYGVSEWPQFKGNAQNTGLASTNVGVTTSTVFEATVDAGTWMGGCVLDDQGNIVFLGLAGKMYSIDSTGTLNWSVDNLGDGNWGGVAYSDTDDAIYSASYGISPEVFKIDANNGNIIWSFATGNTACDHTPTIGPDGTVYLAIGQGESPFVPSRVIAINGDGSLKWSVDFGEGYTAGAIPIYEDEGKTLLFFTSERTTEASGEPNLACIRDDTTQGTTLWTAQIGRSWGEGTVDSAGNYYVVTFTDYVGWYPATAFKFSKDGTMLWSVLSGLNTCSGSPTLSADESALYVSGHYGRVASLKTSDGTRNWLLNLPTAGEAVACDIALTDGTLYVIANDDPNAHFYRIHDLGSKAIVVFSKTLTGQTTSTPCVAASTGTTYVVPEGSTLYALAPEGDTVDILTTIVPDGLMNIEYYAVVTAVGGDRPYTWTKDSGNLPPGLGLNTDGEITGTPTAGGTYNFVAKVTDSSGVPTTDTVALSITVDYPVFQITTTGLSLAEKDVAYSDTLTTNDAPLPITWSIVGGTPGPFSINSGTGELTGTPTAYGDYTFVVQAQDNDSPSNTATKDVTISVLDPNLWGNFQNNKRRIGTAAVIGPGDFVPKWSTSINLGNGSPTIEGDAVYHMRGHPNNIMRYNATTGAQEWVSQDETTDHNRNTCAIGTGTFADRVYMSYGTYYGSSMAVKKSDGTTIWRSVWDDPPPFRWYDNQGLPVTSNGYLYTVRPLNGDGAVYVAEDQGTGWSIVYTGTFNSVHRPPIALLDTVDNGEVMVFGSMDSAVGIYAIKISDWSVLWTSSALGVEVEQCPAISSTNDLFYGGRIPGGYPVVCSLNGATGAANWKTVLSETDGSARRGAGALSYDQDTYYIQWVSDIALGGGQLVAVNTNDGSIKWNFPNGLEAGFGGVAMYSVIADKGGKVYFLYNDGGTIKVACVRDDTTVATLVWEQAITSTIESEEIPKSFSMGGDGTLYFATGIDLADKLWAIKEEAPPPPEIIYAKKGTMEITFPSNTFTDYKVEVSDSDYDYTETNMMWALLADDLPGEAVLTTWTDPSSYKYYRVSAKSVTFGDVPGDVVGSMDVSLGLNRNMVSSPFEPFTAPLYISCAEQITGNVCWTTVLWDAHQWLVPPSYGTFEDDGDQFARTHIPEGGGHWGCYHRIYFETTGCVGTIDASEGAFLEFDIRMYQDPLDPEEGRLIDAYLSSYGDCPDHAYLGRAFLGYFYNTTEAPAYPAWMHMKVDLAELSGDPGFTIDNIDAITFISPGCGTIVNENWIDVKDLKFTLKSRVGSSTLDEAIGDQLTGHSINQFLSDKMMGWDADAQAFASAWYKAGAGWRAWGSQTDPPAFGWNSDEGYMVVVKNAQKDVTLFGRVGKPNPNRVIPLKLGRNLIGVCMPTPTWINGNDRSNLLGSGFTGHPINQFLSDKIEFLKPDQSFYPIWYKTDAGWREWGSQINPPVAPYDRFNPCKAGWIKIKNAAFTWTIPVPPLP